MSSQLERINEDVRSFVERANSEQRGLRVVPLGVAWEVARRSLTQTEEQPFSVRRFRALSAVSDFVSLAQRNKLTTLTVDNSDLLPVAHPASTRKHRMSQFDVLRAQARWYADDARVEDSVVASALLSTLFTESADTPEYEYTYARLAALTAGGLPVMALVAVAIGFNDGANRGFWRQQIRDRKGRWAFMGGGISVNISRNGKVYRQTGQVVSTDAKNGRVRFRTPDNRIVDVDADSFNVDEDVQAILPSRGTSDGVSAEPIRVGSDEVVIPEEDLTVVDSPNGFDRADGSDLPGGMDESQVGEVWQDDLGNYQVARGSFRDGEGEEFVVSRLEEGRVVPLASGGDWNDVQRIIGEDEPNFEKGEDAEPNFPDGFDLTPSAEAADAPESGGDDDGPYQVDRGPYEPRGPREDIDSEGYTDDPADLATQFTPEQIGDALKSAVNEGTGVGFIEFDSDRGDEEVPAEALYNALKVQGVDADQFLDDVEAGKDVKASLPEGADIPGLDEPRNKRFEDAKSTRQLLGDKMPALLQGLSDRELQALIEQDYDFRSLVDDNKDRDVPEGFYKLNEADYDPLGSIPGAPDEMRPFELSLEFSAEQLEERLRAAVGPDAERSGYGRFEMPDSDGESESFDVPAEAIADALKLHAVDTNQLLDEVYSPSEPTDEQISTMLREEDVFGGIDEDKKRELIESTKEGGYTVDFVSGTVPEDGYMVASEADVPDGDGGVAKREEVVSFEEFEANPEKFYEDFVERNVDKLTQEGYYIGTWVSEDSEGNSYVYFDVSERFEDKEEALEAARSREELAIFDIGTFTEIFTAPDGEEQSSVGQQTGEEDDESSGELPRDVGEGTPGVDVEGGEDSSGEPAGADEEVTPPRLFGEETQELDISGDLEAQVNDALENQRELEFAYVGSNNEPTARLVRPVRLETNERTGNVNLLAVDDEGNFKKFTLSKVQPLSDAEESRDNVSGDETPGDEVEVDDASISAENKQMFVEAQSGVVDDVYAGNLRDSFDVEDAGEQDGVNDNVTSDIAQGVDDSAEAADAPDTVEERAVSDVLQEALSGEDARVPSLDNLLSDLGDEDEYDPDIIWQSVSDTYGGKVLENGHIVVSSTMHGDRRYDVVVRRDSNNTFHVFHRVTYPDNTSKVREMGDLGWHSTKALFDKIDKQVVNSVSRPKTTVNKNLKPENNRTLFADNPSPKRKDSFVAADGSILSEGDRVVVSKENHSKAGMGARIIKAENEFDSKQYRYTDYVRVKYDDGEKNWIVSQSLLPESGTSESESEAEPAPENILPSVSTNVDGLSEISVGLSRVFDLLPSSSKVAGDPDVEDVEVQRVAAFINNLSVRSEFESDRLREKAEQSSNDVLVEAQVLKSLSDKASALVSAGVRLKEAGKNSPRSSFYSELSDQLTAAGDNLQGSVDDRTPEIRQEFEQRLSQLVPENLRVSPDEVTFDAVDGFVSDIVNRLPEGDKFAQYQSTRPDVLETPVYQKEGAYHLDNFLGEVRANENDVLSVGLADLDAARDVFDGNPEMSAVVSDLDSLKTAILRGRAGRADTPFAAPDLEELDPLEVRDGRIASGENSFAPGEEFSSYILESANAEGTTVLSDFRQEVADFFDGSERSLAEISPRGRVALQKFADDELKNNPLLSPPVFNDMVDLLKKLESEDRAYFPQRTEVGSDVDSLRGLSFPLDIINTPRGQDVLDDNGDPTGWTVAERASEGINEAIQLRNNATGQLLWVKQEMSEGNARSEYASSRISQLMGFSGAPIVEIVKNDPKLLFITQAGDTVRLNGDAERYSDVYGEFGPPSSQLKDIALLDIVKMSIMDTAIDNGDRHGGNFLVGVKDQLGVGDDSGATRLFPIDHGMGNAFLFDRLTNTEEYLTDEGSSGGALARLLAESMGGARFKELTVPIIDDLVAGLRNEINDDFYSNNPNVFRGMTAVIDRLEEYKNLDVSVFESLQP